MVPLRSEARSFWEKQKIRLFLLFFLTYLLIITEIAGMHDPGIRLAPGRIHQEHHRLQSVVASQLDATHTRYGWGQGGVSNTRKKTLWRLQTLLQWAKLLRLRGGKEVMNMSGWKHWPFSTDAFYNHKLIKKRTKITWRANNQRASELASKAWILLSNFTVIQIVEQLYFGTRYYHMYAVQAKFESVYTKKQSKYRNKENCIAIFPIWLTEIAVYNNLKASSKIGNI